MNRSIFPVALVFALQLFIPCRAADKPCEHETKPLMSIKTSWPDLFRAAGSLPRSCFSGYFAEGISDTVVRKMAQDWAGFTQVLSHHPDNKAFFSIVLKALNSTLNPDDIQAVNQLATTSCPIKLRRQCDALSRRAQKALSDYDPPIPV